MRRIMVSNAGGTISQSIAKRILSQEWPEEVVVYGLCNRSEVIEQGIFSKLIELPSSYSELNGIDEDWVRNECSRNDIQLLIPTTDFETVGFSKIKETLCCKTLVSSYQTCLAFHDKWETFLAFQRAGLQFANSSLPSLYHGQFDLALAKPRTGGLSKGIVNNYTGSDKLSDNYVVQEHLAIPEFTLALYVTSKQQILGPIIFERHLRFGMTSACLIRHELFEWGRNFATRFCSTFEICGPCNVQLRTNPKNELVAFEVNCRYSGTCGIRAQLGYPDIDFCILDNLFNITPEYQPVLRGGGVKRIFEKAWVTATDWPDLNVS